MEPVEPSGGLDEVEREALEAVELEAAELEAVEPSEAVRDVEVVQPEPGLSRQHTRPSVGPLTPRPSSGLFGG